MKLQAIKNLITSKAGRQILKIRKNSPSLMFAAGVVGVIGTAVLASRATYKLEDVLVETDEQLDKIRSLEHANYSEDDRQKDIVLCYIKTGFKIAGLYAPAVVVGALSITALTGAHVTLTRRNLSMTAAYAALDKGFRAYRERVVKELGVDKDREFRYEMENHEVIGETDQGPMVTMIKRPKDGSLIYGRFFEKGTTKNWKPSQSHNQMFIQCQQEWANNLLRYQGHVFLNEVYDMLGFERSREGAVVGWILNSPEGDGFIDFGIFDNDLHSGLRFINGDEPSVLLDFNVDGIIWDKI